MTSPPFLANSFLLTAHTRNTPPLGKGERGKGDRVAGLAGWAWLGGWTGLAGWSGLVGWAGYGSMGLVAWLVWVYGKDIGFDIHIHIDIHLYAYSYIYTGEALLLAWICWTSYALGQERRRCAANTPSFRLDKSDCQMRERRGDRSVTRLRVQEIIRSANHPTACWTLRKESSQQSATIIQYTIIFSIMHILLLGCQKRQAM